MFETSLVQRQRNRRWGAMLVSAVALHAIAATAVVLASVWNVAEVEPPALDETLYVALPPPLGDDTAPKPPKPAPAPPKPQTAAQPQPPAPKPPETQPVTVPDALPVPPAVAPTDEDVSPGPASDAPSTGGDGVPWGTNDGAGADDAARDITAEMTRPEVVQRVTPLYTEEARRARIEGVVIVRATIDRTGRVTDVQVLKPLPLGLDRSAVAAVQQWRFRPATLNGRPVPVFFQLSVKFNIQ